MDFEYPERTQELCKAVHAFVEDHVAPRDAEWRAEAHAGKFPLAIVDSIKQRAREQGLWNLFLPSLRNDQPGTRLTNLEYAPLAEITGRYPWCPEVFNCNSPDSGNMEILQLCATPEQRERWLDPLLDGSTRSCFSMTEPATASSDPTNLQTTMIRDGDHYLVKGRKWFSTGARHPNCKFSIVMGRSDLEGEREPYSRYSMIIVPFGTPGLRIVRDVSIMNHHSPEGHCEIDFDVRVPADNMLGKEGDGFKIAQARLGPGRIHHCMRTIGQCEFALELMIARAKSRIAFGSALADYANIQDWIAESRIEIDQARLLVLRAAWLMDKGGNKAARVDVSAIKIVAARLQTRVLDRAIQVFGAAGLTEDTPLAYLWTWGRALRFIDGPDEVHLRTVARAEMKKTDGASRPTRPASAAPASLAGT
jgi:acyl-CoA dehydrogenase